MNAAEDRVRPIEPAPDKISQFFWDAAREHRLEILRCNQCGHFTHWPRIVCKSCLSYDVAPAVVSGRGTVYTFTIAVQAFHASLADQLPYVLGVIELEEQKDLRLVSRIVGCPEDELRAGLPVEVFFQKVSDTLTLPLFRPIAGGSGESSKGQDRNG
ncbi:MAG: Zn-ribbon domain-containing OB-fold protein [Acidimicrobiia bacterium]